MKWIYLLTLIFFGAWLWQGLGLVDDFGISYDEAFERDLGRVNMQYINERFHFSEAIFSERSLMDFNERRYGPVFTTVSYALELQYGISGFREVYLFRHKLCFILSWATGLAFYLLCLMRWQSPGLALLGGVFFLLSPLTFAHGYFNPKDLPMMAFCTWFLAAFSAYLYRPSWWRAVLAAICIGLTIATRISGLVVLALALAFWLVRLFPSRGAARRKWLVTGTIFLVGSMGFTVAFWPFLWDAPAARLWEVYHQMSQFQWEGGQLLHGRRFSSTQLPFYYLPLWIAVTTPLLYLALFLQQFFVLSRRGIKAVRAREWPFSTPGAVIDWLMLSVIAASIVLVFITRPVLLNGWRHFLFLYPPLLYMALGGWRHWWLRGGTARRVLLLLTALSCLSLAHFMYANHPHQHVYFNALAGKEQLGRYNLDYWGLSFQEGYRQLAQKDRRDSISVATNGFPGSLNHTFLPDSLRRRFHYVQESDSADYFLTNLEEPNFDWRPYYQQRVPPYNGTPFIEIRSGQNLILQIFQNRPVAPE